MAGALGMAVSRRRRGFASGGSAGGAAMYGDPTGMDDSGDEAAPYDTTQPSGDQGAQGALTRRSGQTMDPETAQRVTDLRNAQAILAAGGGPPPGAGMDNALRAAGGPLASQMDGATNLPLLAAAGALLKPTRTGGFAESLGGAMEAGAGALSQQRQLEENARLRAAQLADTAAWRQGMVGVNQQRAGSYQQMADARTDQAAAAQERAANAAAAASKTDMVYVGTTDDGQSMFYNKKDPGATIVVRQPIGMKPLDASRADQGQQRIDLQRTLGQARINVAQASQQQRADAFAEHKREFEVNQGRQITAAENNQLLRTYGLSKDMLGKSPLPLPTMKPFNGQGAASPPAQQQDALPDPLGIR